MDGMVNRDVPAWLRAPSVATMSVPNEPMVPTVSTRLA